MFLGIKLIIMKRITISLIAILLFSMSFIGCDKEEDVIKQNETNITEDKQEAPAGIILDFLVVEYDGEGNITKIYCTWMPGNCFPIVEILSDYMSSTPSFLAAEFMALYEQGNISEFFGEQDYNQLFPELDQSLVNEIISGNVILHKMYSEEEAVNYFIGLDANIVFETEKSSSNDENVSWYGEQQCVLRIKDNRE
jgi:hypothetical protein